MISSTKPCFSGRSAGRDPRGNRWRAGAFAITLVGAELPRASGALFSGPYRSLRELSLAGLVGSVIWRPPTFVGNPGSLPQRPARLRTFIYARAMVFPVILRCEPLARLRVSFDALWRAPQDDG